MRHGFEQRAQALEGREKRLSGARLVLFLVGAIATTGGLYDGAVTWVVIGCAGLAGFVVAVVAHLRVLRRLDRANVRRQVHARHLDRLGRGWRDFPADTALLDAAHHPYALDIDLTGPGSLVQRIDVTHTRQGQARLVEYLSAAAPVAEGIERQAAVAELASKPEFRQELEAAAFEAPNALPLDGTGFKAFADMAPVFGPRPWLGPTIIVLPAMTVGSLILGQLGLVPKTWWLLPLTLQATFMFAFQRAVSRAFNLGAARQGVVEAFERMLELVEKTSFDAPLLARLRGRLIHDGQAPSSQLARLRRWVSFGELRQQFMLWAAVNPLLLWDLHVLRGMEAWNRQAGQYTEDWFVVLGELEALASLATLHALEPASVFPELAPSTAALELQSIGHPLLSPGTRVHNDLTLAGAGHALIVTGSNMAGKSTLLRAVGLNMALGLAGGPVCARSATIPHVRLRAAMRAQDNLQEGASYFHAELTKLRSVVDGADDAPPLFFLLDELLRGTNERARHLGAKAVLLHLLNRGATGLVATHDVALAALEDSLPERIQNMHFTDVMDGDEMRFDYRLRPGIVKTSNALRLLAMAGIEVPSDANRPGDGALPDKS